MTYEPTTTQGPGTKPGTCPRCGALSESFRVFDRWLDSPCEKCFLAQEKEEMAKKRRERISAASSAFSAMVSRFPDYDPARTNWTRISAHLKEGAKAWLEDRPSAIGLVLAGATGTGKTRTLFRVMQRLAEEGIKVGYVAHTDLANLAIAAAQGDPQAAGKIAGLKRAEMIAIDDLGKGGTSERATGIVYEIVEYFTSRQKPILATTQAGGNWLIDRFGTDRGEAIVQRLNRCCRIVSAQDSRPAASGSN